MRGLVPAIHVLICIRNDGRASPARTRCESYSSRQKDPKRMTDAPVSEAPTYEPPKVWTWNKGSGGRFASINRPIAGPTHEKELPVGRHPLQLYALATPNGVKVTVLLEELLAKGHAGAEYDAWMIPINVGEQFGSGFVAVNPN